jgi:hypothetical protein
MLACFRPDLRKLAVTVAMPGAKELCRIDATGPSTELNWKLHGNTVCAVNYVFFAVGNHRDRGTLLVLNLYGNIRAPLFSHGLLFSVTVDLVPPCHNWLDK